MKANHRQAPRGSTLAMQIDTTHLPGPRGHDCCVAELPDEERPSVSGGLFFLPAEPPLGASNRRNGVTTPSPGNNGSAASRSPVSARRCALRQDKRGPPAATNSRSSNRGFEPGASLV